MASTPDPHPDSAPAGPEVHPDELVPGTVEPGRGSVEDLPDSPGMSGGTAGTGGDNKVQDDLDR